MLTLLEQVTEIVAEREYQYHLIVADMYFMAVLTGDLATAQQIWEEAWSNDASLLPLLTSRRQRE